MKLIENALSKDDLIKLFIEVGVKSGMILEVHSSLSKFGYVIGGAQTFNDALIEVLGYNGTIIMPLQSASMNEPSFFEFPPIARELFSKYRDSLPAYDMRNTDSEMMGKVVSNLRRRSKSVISCHPNCSFVAYGKYAKVLCEHQKLDYALSDTSPLGRLYELKSHCLLAGVDYDNMTSLHLSEYRSSIRPIILQGTKIMKNDRAVWEKYLDLDLNSDDGFLEIGKSLENKKLVNIIDIPKGKMKLLRVDVAVDEGMHYFDKMLEYYKK